MRDDLSTVEILGAIAQIKQLNARRLGRLDTRDWRLLRSVFADDACMDVRGAFEMPQHGLMFEVPPVLVGATTSCRPRLQRHAYQIRN